MKEFLLFIYLVSVAVFFGGAVLLDKILKMELQKHGKEIKRNKLMKSFAEWFFILLISVIPGLRLVAALLSLSVYIKIVQDIEEEERQQRITRKTYNNERQYELKDGTEINFANQQEIINYIGKLEDTVKHKRIYKLFK